MEKQYSCPLQIKTLAQYSFEGYASVFDVHDHDYDIIRKGAFSKAQAEQVKLLWQHKFDEPIGIIEQLYEDSKGLFVKAQLSNISARGREAFHLMQMGAIDSLSIGFKVVKSNFNILGAREITEAKLYEVSLVTFPANENAKVHQIKCANSDREIHKAAKRAIKALWGE